MSVGGVGVRQGDPALSTSGSGTTRAAKPERGIAHSVASSFRLVIAGSVVMTLLLGGLLGWLLTVSRPDVSRFEQGLAALDDQKSSLLDQETGLRGFLSTGQPAFLDPYQLGVSDMATADRGLLAVASSPRPTNSVIGLRLAEQRWVDEWATPAASGHIASAIRTPAARDRFLAQGKKLFDEYRVAEVDTEGLISSELKDLRAIQVRVLVSVAVCALLVAASAAVVAFRLRTRLQRSILAPVDVLLSGLQAVRAGDLQHCLSTEGPVELSQVIAGFNEMTFALSAAAKQAEVSESQILDQTLSCGRCSGWSARSAAA